MSSLSINELSLCPKYLNCDTKDKLEPAERNCAVYCLTDSSIDIGFKKITYVKH